MTVKAMTVADLIAELQKHPQDLPVAYSLYSEFCLMEPGCAGVMDLGEARPDGWVHRARPDKPTRKYLIIT